MNVIACPWGIILKFDDLEDLKRHTENLAGFVEHTESAQANGEEVKFAYAISEDGPVTAERVGTFLDDLNDLPVWGG